MSGLRHNVYRRFLGRCLGGDFQFRLCDVHRGAVYAYGRYQLCRNFPPCHGSLASDSHRRSAQDVFHSHNRILDFLHRGKIRGYRRYDTAVAAHRPRIYGHILHYINRLSRAWLPDMATIRAVADGAYDDKRRLRGVDERWCENRPYGVSGQIYQERTIPCASPQFGGFRDGERSCGVARIAVKGGGLPVPVHHGDCGRWHRLVLYGNLAL